jgi:RibD C-terminal domain.
MTGMSEVTSPTPAAGNPVQAGRIRMGRLIYSMSVSLDGFVETPSRSLDWVTVDEELHSFFNDEAREMSAFLYGRRLYELMVDYWPTAETDPSATPAMLEFARIWKDKPKIVFSRTLGRVEWNSRLVRDDAAEGGCTAQGAARVRHGRRWSHHRLDVDAARADRRVPPLRASAPARRSSRHWTIASG